MNSLVQKRFLPTDYEWILFTQYQNYRQGNRNVEDYTMEFHRLAAQNDLAESESQAVARYVGGLKIVIQEKFQLHTKYGVTYLVNSWKNVSIYSFIYDTWPKWHQKYRRYVN